MLTNFDLRKILICCSCIILFSFIVLKYFLNDLVLCSSIFNFFGFENVFCVFNNIVVVAFCKYSDTLIEVDIFFH